MKKFALVILTALAVFVSGCGNSPKASPTQLTERPSIDMSSPLAKLLLEDNLKVLVTGVASPGPIRLQAIISSNGVADTVISRDYAANDTRIRVSFRYPISVSEMNNDGVVDFKDFFLFADCFGGNEVNRFDLNNDGVVDINDFAQMQSYLNKKPIQFSQKFDLNMDNDVNMDDFFLLTDYLNNPENVQYDPSADFNKDGVVDFNDFFLFADEFGTSIENATPTRQYYLRVMSLAGIFAPVQVIITGEMILTTHDVDINVSTTSPPKSAVLNLTSTNLNFGNVTIHIPSTATLTVANIGDTTLTGTISVSGAGFVTSATNISVAAKSTQLVNVSFAPALVTTYTGTISIVTNGGSGNVSLTGSGINAATPVLAVSPTIVNFDSVLVGEWASRSIIIQNTGTDVLSVISITSSAAQMTVSPSTGIIIPGSSMGVTVIYTPTTTSTTNCNLVVNSNAGSFTIAATGIGKAPAVPEEPSPMMVFAQARVRAVDYPAGGGFSTFIGEPIFLSMKATGTTPDPLYEWQVSTNGGGSWTHIAYSDTTSYTFTGFSSRAKVRGVARNPNDLSKERVALWNVQILAATP